MRARPGLLVLALASAMLSSAPALGRGRIADRIVAVVDGRLLTLAALRLRAAPFVRQMERGKGPGWRGESTEAVWKAEALHKALGATLDAIVDDTLFEEVAQGLGTRTDEAAVEGAIREVAARGHLTREALLHDLYERFAFTEADTRAEYRRQLIERAVLAWAYDRAGRGAWPGGDDEGSVKARADFREAWLAAQRAKACIEQRFVP